MTSRRKSSIGGFHKITVQKAKFKDCKFDIIDYRKLKQEPLSEGEDFKEENNNKIQKTKGQENVLKKVATGRISELGTLKYGTYFEMSDAKKSDSDDVLKDSTSDAPYKSNFEDATMDKDKGDKKKQVKKCSTQFLVKKEDENFQPHSKTSKSKLREEPFKCDVSKNKKNERGHKQGSFQKFLSNGINEVASANVHSKNNSLSGYSGNEPVQEDHTNIFKSGSTIRGNTVKSKTKKEDENSVSKANLHMFKTATKPPKLETKSKEDKQDNKSKKFCKEMKNGDSPAYEKLKQEATMPQRLQNVRRSKRIASLAKVCYKEISLFKGK